MGLWGSKTIESVEWPIPAVLIVINQLEILNNIRINRNVRIFCMNDLKIMELPNIENWVTSM